MLPIPSFQTACTSTHGTAAAPLNTVVRAQLPCTTRASSNRRRAQELAWQWVAAKWPRLMPLPRDMEHSHIERMLHDHALRVSTSSDGATWTLSVAHGERRSQRVWTTRLQVTDTGHADVLEVQTSCSESSQTPLIVAPPKILGAWVEQLALDDGGFAVLSEPRHVRELTQLDAFCAHVLSDRRNLPVIALTHKAQSRHFGVDPVGLALAVRGLAHVACLSPEVAASVPAMLGQGSAVVHGTARIFAPGFHARSPDERHPLVRDTHAQASGTTDDPGSFRRKLCRHICAMSVAGSR